MRTNSAVDVMRAEPDFAAATNWEFQSAVGALAAATPEELPDRLIMVLLASAADRQTFNRLFEEIFRRYNQRVEAWCYKLTKDRERARDLMQEVFLKAFRNVHRFRGESQLSTWLYVIARNHCYNYLKKSRLRPEGDAAEPPLKSLRDPSEDVQSSYERAQHYREVYRLISSLLTPIELRVITLHYVHDLTLPAITRRLMLSNRSGAKAAIVSARRKLKRAARDENGFGKETGALAVVAHRRSVA